MSGQTDMTRKQVMIDILEANYENTLQHLYEAEKGLPDGYTEAELEALIVKEDLEFQLEEWLADEEY